MPVGCVISVVLTSITNKSEKKKADVESDSDLSSSMNNLDSPTETPETKRKSSSAFEGMSQKSIPKRRRLSKSTNGGDPSIIEFNVGGKIFATTIQTVNREMSLLSSMVSGEGCKRDKEGRIFIDRDPTHFRWILNYLRDGFLVSVPANMQDRLELLQESRCYHLPGLSTLLEHHQNTHKDPPTFLTARPSTKGLFYISGDAIKWSAIQLTNIKPTWSTISMKFEEGKDEVTFLSINIDRQSGVATNHDVVCISKLIIDKTAKASITVTSEDGNAQSADVMFWWEPSTGQYPQLYMRITRLDFSIVRGLDFFRTTAE